jgi:PTS system mannose-specific IIA component
MVGIVVVGHGHVAEGMVHTLEGVLGPVEALEAVSTNASDTADAIREHIAQAVTRVDRGAGVIILTDMLGDTPTNQSLAVARERGVEVVAGVNMPILFKVATARAGTDAATLARFIQRYGQEHIFWATEPPAVRTRQAR